MQMEIVFQPIARVSNHYPYPGKPSTWYGTESKIVLDQRWVPALEGLTDFSHIVVLCYLHLVPKEDPPIHVRPGGNPNMPLIGFLSTRSPHRPNRISVSMARLLKIKDNILHVRNLDMFDGTPVLDIKPYLFPSDEPDQITVAQWVHDLRKS
jgi:tRNA-Thr(GGU) m(6)t(6)A37 methyltransferase TsaA